MKLEYIFDDTSPEMLQNRLSNFASSDRNIVFKIYGENLLISKKPIMRDSFNLEFRGSIKDNGKNGAVLTGRLGIPLFTKVFCIFAFLFVGFCFSILLCGSFLEYMRGNTDFKFIILFGAAICGFAIIFLLMGTAFQKSNKKYIIDFIEKVKASLEKSQT